MLHLKDDLYRFSGGRDQLSGLQAVHSVSSRVDDYGAGKPDLGKVAGRMMPAGSDEFFEVNRWGAEHCSLHRLISEQRIRRDAA